MDKPTPNLALWLAFLAMNERATRDWLTGLYNRRFFEETLDDHIEAAKRYDRKLSLILFDLDYFKQINDTQGHDAGDSILQKFAATLKSSARAADIICRYGGDEFAVILPETGPDSAQIFADRVKKETPHPASTGIASLPNKDLISMADNNLIKNKQMR